MTRGASRFLRQEGRVEADKLDSIYASNRSCSFIDHKAEENVGRSSVGRRGYASLPGPHKISGIALLGQLPGPRCLDIIWQRVINCLQRVRARRFGHCFSFYYHFINTAVCFYGRIKAETCRADSTAGPCFTGVVA